VVNATRFNDFLTKILKDRKNNLLILDKPTTFELLKKI
jgi:hypothetical protein